MKIVFFVILNFMAFSAFATDFRCYSSKFPTDMVHAFQDGFTTLSIEEKVVTLKYFYINTLAHETKLEYAAEYELVGQKGGNGRLSSFYVARFVSSRTGTGLDERIATLYLDPALLGSTSGPRQFVGQFVFSGHGYNYDWNRCYLK